MKRILTFKCESCFATFTVGENLTDYNHRMMITSPCECYQCNNTEADKILEDDESTFNENEVKG